MLSEAQRRAVTHPGGPAIVLAGPGSGKTYTIVNRIIYLIEYQQVSPDTILVITFTKAAALSMQSRFEESTGGKFAGVWFGTFHSFFYQILKEYDSYNNNSLFETEEKKQFIKGILERQGIDLEDYGDVLRFFHDFASLMPDGVTEEQAKLIAQQVKEEMRKERKLDFDDMAGLVMNLFQNKPQVLKQLKHRHKYILVDEYQDINYEQEEILALLAAPENELMVVGDDDQSIYGFRGSKPAVMKNFGVRYPEAENYYLEMNYRSTKQIVDAAMAVINENTERFLKDLCAKTEEGEAVNCIGFESKKEEYEYIACQILDLKKEQGLSFSDMAIITRSNKEQEALMLFLQKKGIHCFGKENRKSIGEHFVAKEMIQCLEFVVGKRNRAPAVWNKMDGNETKRKLLSKQLPIPAIHFIYHVMGYKNVLKNIAITLEKTEGIEAKVWLEEWEKILSHIRKHGENYKDLKVWVFELEDFLKNILPERSWEGVHFMTMHGAKGLEFAYVCIPDANEGVIPGKRCRKKEEIEEERRLFYVAMTRAKKILDILYLKGTPEYPRLPSRFLNPLLKKKNNVRTENPLTKDYSASSTNSSNSTLSKNSSKASATASYSSSSSMKISSGSTLGSFSSSRYP